MSNRAKMSVKCVKMAKTKKNDSTSFRKSLFRFQMGNDVVYLLLFLISRHGIVPQKTNIWTKNPHIFPETQMQQISKFSK